MCARVTMLHDLMDLRRDVTADLLTELCDLSLLLYSYVTFHLENLVCVFLHNSGVIHTNGNGVP